MNSRLPLNELRADFLASSTQSFPIAGIIFWTIIAVAALYITPVQLGYVVGFGSGMIFPLGMLIDRVRGKKATSSNNENPVLQLFLQSLGLVVLVWPFVILAAARLHDANMIVLGAAILMGIIWIPYGWAADDRVGMEHAIGRCVMSYAAFLLAPQPYKASAISIAVLLSYCYSLLRMRQPPAVRIKQNA